MTWSCVICGVAVMHIDLSLPPTVPSDESVILKSLLRKDEEENGVKVGGPMVLCSFCLGSIQKIMDLHEEMEAIKARMSVGTSVQLDNEKGSYESSVPLLDANGSVRDHHDTHHKLSVASASSLNVPHTQAESEKEEKVYNCRKCKASFANIYDLTLHQRKDHLMTPFRRTFACPLCKAFFFTAGLFLGHTHLDPLHDPSKVVYTCHSCDMIYKSRALFQNHLTLVHNNKEV